ncbi:unnamed protein product [Caenorhabditis auriculariae]|uniref:beta-ketoacyl-[acyl-carrier-protein] synthase I n=1 Tax=Caenorhabditis auriculariae TaxID=2777116 RepID=A0A8S1GYB8_9PELO|nr:unnamed protein product [Caenorhabditis auriculariae]
MYRVVVTGMGSVTPFGRGVAALRAGLLEDKSALRFDDGLKFVVGSVPESPELFGQWSTGEKREMSRGSMMTLVAADEVSQGLELCHEETLVNIGTCMADLEHIGETAEKVKNGQVRKVSPYFVPRILNNLPAGYVAMKYKMMGGVESTSTACATGLHCIGNAFRSVRHGWARRALAGATECAVNPISIAGFDRMRALAHGDSPKISRPFDKSRSGFVLSEGSGVVFLERLEDALERNAPILVEIVGYGLSSDAHHISTPEPSGIGAKLAMSRALRDGNLPESDVDYVNAHATSTPRGDTIEAKAIRDVFQRDIAVSSVKGHIGHLLGAAGSVETIATICALMDRKLPANLNLEESEDDGKLQLLRKSTPWTSKTPIIAIVNSFGFGATNSSLLLREFQS